MAKDRQRGRERGRARYSGIDVIERYGDMEVEGRGSKWLRWI